MNLDYNICETLERYSKVYPEKVALHNGNENITYSELHLRIMQLSQLLQATGIKKGDIIAVYIPNSIEMLVSIYAILYARAIVLPIDFESPLERVSMIFSNSHPALVLCKKENQNEIERFHVKSMAVDSVSFNTNTNEDAIDNSSHNILEDDAFCIYTSGTTAIPKGVLLNYKGILNHASAKVDLLNLTQNSKLCLSFNIGFVASIWQILVPILIGAELFIYEKNLIKKPYLFFKQVEADNIIAVSVTPHTLQGYLEYIKVKKQKLSLSNITHIILTGEKVSSSLVKEFYENYDSITLINAYGQTECSDDTYHYVIPHSFNRVHMPIGIPINNMTGFVLGDDYIENNVGELFIGGVGVANGYISNQELTDQKFVKLPLFNAPLFRTGDWVQRMEDGNLIYLGRVDNQVKIRGYRVELEEIEAHLNQFNGIKRSVVRALETSKTNKVLEAFYSSDNAINAKDITDYLSTKLPEYMIPVVFRRVKDFIETTNGKIDRKRLSDCLVLENSLTNNSATILSGKQKKVFEIIVSTIESIIGDITLETELASAGVDSITFIKIVVALEGEFDFEFDDEMLLITAFPTIKSMIDYVESKVHGA